MSIRSSYACSYNEGVAAAYEWDETKSQENLSKHGLSFDDADIVFSGPCVTFEDTRFDYGEPRFITLGHLEGHVVVVALTPRRIGLICYLPDFKASAVTQNRPMVVT